MSVLTKRQLTKLLRIKRLPGPQHPGVAKKCQKLKSPATHCSPAVCSKNILLRGVPPCPTTPLGGVPVNNVPLEGVLQLLLLFVWGVPVNGPCAALLPPLLNGSARQIDTNKHHSLAKVHRTQPTVWCPLICNMLSFLNMHNMRGAAIKCYSSLINYGQSKRTGLKVVKIIFQMSPNDEKNIITMLLHLSNC